ncbi:MAG: hypothetical protein ACPKPY_07120 [Nitrososphaeraceae archaeon]
MILTLTYDITLDNAASIELPKDFGHNVILIDIVFRSGSIGEW